MCKRGVFGSVSIAGISGIALLGLTALGNVSAGTAGPDLVYTVTPCRILDTRLGVGDYAGKLQPNQTLDLMTDNFGLGGTIIAQGGSPSGCPDIPNEATGLFINVIAVEASGTANNDLGIRPWGSSSSATAINYQPGVYALNNGLFVGTCYGQRYYGFPPFPALCPFNITLINGAGASAHVVIDVTGFTRWY
jgi:hypothetical protein